MNGYPCVWKKRSPLLVGNLSTSTSLLAGNWVAFCTSRRYLALEDCENTPLLKTHSVIVLTSLSQRLQIQSVPEYISKGSAMTDIARLFQAFLAPAIFVSATALLILSINVRLMGIVSRLRQYVHAKHDAAKNGRVQEAEAYTAQISSIEQRAGMIRRCFLLVLISLAGTIVSCLLLGLGLYWKEAAMAAVVLFVLAMICLLAGTFYYLREIAVSLSSVHKEACDSRFMELGAPREIHGYSPL
jgi:hypothetical protein